MGLTDKEKETLKALEKKRDTPDPPPVSRSISATIDFGDEAQIERAIKHGFLTRAEAEEQKDGDDDDDNDDDSDSRRRSTRKPDRKPSRKGYFDK